MIEIRLPHVLIPAVIALSCSSRETPVAAGPDLGTPEVNLNPDAGARQSAAQPIWRPSSRRIELSSFGFWQGSTAYAKDRADLTPEQLKALEGLRTTTPPDLVGADFTSYEVRVIDEDGSVAEYRAADGNVRDSDERTGAADLPTIDIETLKPFLDTIRCLSAKAVRSIVRTTDAPIDPSKLDMSTAVEVPADTACVNGVFVPYECSDAALKFDVATRTIYEFTSGRCLDTLSLRVYTGDRTKLLAESTPGTAESCFSLRHTFEPGSYVLVFSKTNAGGCTTKGHAGDTSLRLRIVK